MTDPGIPETGHFKTTLSPRELELQVIANDALARLATAEAECERLRAELDKLRRRAQGRQTMGDAFADDVLERLAQSNNGYQRTHGHYIVPLSQRLLDARAECERLRTVLTNDLHLAALDYEECAAARDIARAECEHLRALLECKVDGQLWAEFGHLRAALAEIEHYPVSASLDAVTELLAVKEIARRARGGRR